ncbi:MAG: FKBP-type peptidyl-prolyl cis-trans isomerase [Flavobacteriales bacterium]
MKKQILLSLTALFTIACSTQETDEAAEDIDISTEVQPSESIATVTPQPTFAEIAAKNAQEGENFLKEIEAKAGVKKTESGLCYEVIKPGKGKKPGMQGQVQVHYHGTHIDGRVFDSSVERGEPITFNLGQVIIGWQEGLQLMPEGSTYKLYIPSKLAYGEGGTGSIGPNEVLIFEVELLGIR